MTKRGYHQAPNERQQERIRLQLAGESGQTTPRLAGRPLTQEEYATVAALAEAETLERQAAVLCCHVNTVKYRLGRVRAKLGLPRDASRAAIYGRAMERGDVLVPHASTGAVLAFVAVLAADLDEGPLGDGVRAWLNEQAEAFLADRSQAEAAA